MHRCTYTTSCSKVQAQRVVALYLACSQLFRLKLIFSPQRNVISYCTRLLRTGTYCRDYAARSLIIINHFFYIRCKPVQVAGSVVRPIFDLHYSRHTYFRTTTRVVCLPLLTNNIIALTVHNTNRPPCRVGSVRSLWSISPSLSMKMLLMIVSLTLESSPLFSSPMSVLIVVIFVVFYLLYDN
jgi:hypothetical protein